ncbi:MAG TPA: type II secretion system protein [Albitalea sp.]
MKHPVNGPAHRGFTLLEAVAVIALTGIVGAMVGIFLRAPITGYVDQVRRAELTDAGDLALRRMARELHRALPNSVRVDTARGALEFIPVVEAGRYRAAPDNDGAGDALDIDVPADNAFDVLGAPVDVPAGAQLVVYNLGLPGADAYAGDNRRALTTTGAGLASLAYATGGVQLPFASPGHRFHVVGAPVTFLCPPGAGTLRRYTGYALQAAQPTQAAAPPLASLAGTDNTLLADRVSCRFAYDPDVTARNGLVTLTLTLAADGESVTLLHQVHVDNSP